MNPIDLPNIRMITVSGRIAAGSTTLAKGLSETLSWRQIEGGEVFWEQVRKELNLKEEETNKRPDQKDLDFDEQTKKLLSESSHIILESKLAGFNSQNIPGVYKILVLCEDENGTDQTRIRIDRLLNREGISIDEAKKEVIEREHHDLEKWRKLYANGDQNWTYIDKKYYDLVVNTYNKNKDQTLDFVLDAIGFKKNT